MKRTMNIIERAINEFGMAVDMNESLQDIFDQAQNTIEDNVEYDYISECERNNHFDHISWNDGNGFDLEADGEFINREERFNKFYRFENDKYKEVAWYDHNDDTDYVMVYDCLDTDGQRARLVCRC